MERVKVEVLSYLTSSLNALCYRFIAQRCSDIMDYGLHIMDFTDCVTADSEVMNKLAVKKVTRKQL